MSRAYASGTTVTAAQTEGEIKALLAKRKVAKIATMVDGDHFDILFEYESVTYRISLPLPNPEDARFTEYKQGSKIWARTATAARELYEKELNRKWRAFGAVIKAKIVAVEEGISSMEKEFIGNVVLKGGQTVAEQWAPQLPRLAASGDIRSLPERGI